MSRDDRDPFEGGIGGTGVVGTLYGFGSLRINGLRVEINGRTRYTSALGPISAEALRQGHTLTVAAERTSDGIVAREVTLDYALIGLLRHNHGVATVNGVPLIAPAAFGHGASGARVAVSGTWTAAGLRPNRIDPAPDARDLIAGTVNRGDTRALSIGGVELAAQVSGPLAGSYAVAFGRAEAGGFVVDRFQSTRFASMSRLQLLSVEGYLEPSPVAPGIRIAGLGHNFARDVRLNNVGQNRAIYFGRYDGLFGARLGFLVPDDYDARRQLLEPGLGDGFAGTVIRI